MITISQALPAATPGASPSAAPADAADAATIDFSALLGLGVAPAEEPAAGVTATVAPGEPISAETQEPVDPASLLDAIAAAQPAPDPAAAMASPLPPSPPVARAVSAGAAVASGAAGADPIASATPEPGKPDFAPGLPRHAEASVKGAAVDLRAEAGARPVPESQSLTHHLHAQGVPHALRDPGPAQVQLQLPQQLATPSWNEGLADHAVWMARNDVQTAELHLNPADLGPIEVTLTLTGDDKSQATVQFSAAHAGTREAIETALPRLREMMQESGITLGQAGVDDHTRQAVSDNGQHAQDGDRGRNRARDDGARAGTGTIALPTPGAARAAGRGLVDTFA